MAEWAYVENNEIVELHDLLPVSWRNISGLRNAADNIEFLNSVGWYRVVKDNSEHDTILFAVDTYTYDFIDNNVCETKILKQAFVPANNFQQLKLEFMHRLREKRNNILALSDYTQLEDVQQALSSNERYSWKVYRQSLRDLPALYADNNELEVDSVIWPSYGLLIEPQESNNIDQVNTNESLQSDTEPVINNSQDNLSNNNLNEENVEPEAEDPVESDVNLNANTSGE
jgi:hypothetical protein